MRLRLLIRVVEVSIRVYVTPNIERNETARHVAGVCYASTITPKRPNMEGYKGCFKDGI